jgi:hypothetical protein
MITEKNQQLQNFSLWPLYKKLLITNTDLADASDCGQAAKERSPLGIGNVAKLDYICLPRTLFSEGR